MNSQYILDPSDAIARRCSEVGGFLEDDYYMSMSHNEVPSSYWHNVEEKKDSNRRIVILGTNEPPMTITKNAFLAHTLAKPEKLTVKVSSKDEAILLREMFSQNDHYSDCEYFVYQSMQEELESNGAWLRDVEQATDIVVFGGLDTISFLDMESTKDQNVWIHKPKFSFGVVTKECLDNEDNLAGMVGDFISYFGEGTLAPRFYATIGNISKDQIDYIVECIKNEQDIIQEFRNKLPFSKKFVQIQSTPFEKFIYPHIKKSNFDSPEFLAPLFGDIRIVEVKGEHHLKEFIYEYQNVISTIALDEDTMGDTAASWDLEIPRYCDIGSMQFPYFYEPIDHLDDMYVYSDNTKLF